MVAEDLLTAGAVRDAADRMFLLADTLGLPQWRLDMSRMAVAADLTAETVRANYPTSTSPSTRAGATSRRRAATFGTRPRSRRIPLELARAAFDMVIPSVLLDAGAGPAWRYRDATGAELSRSEGLGVASLRMWNRAG